MAKIFIAGGGTGGHFYPALSVAKKFKDAGFEVIYIGTLNGIEAKKDFPYGEKHLFDIHGIRGRGIFSKILGTYKLILTTFNVYKMILKEKPVLSFCFGGYTSLPLGFASLLSSTPLFIHEQNSVPSYTNLILSKFAKKIFITFSYSAKYFNKKKTVLSGMPIREEIIKYAQISSQNKVVKKIAVLGGSQGAKRLNQIALEVARKFPNIQFLIIKGKADIDTVVPQNVTIFDYVDDIQKIYMDCDIVISRAGSGVVNELLAFGKYAIYVPYPYAASNHQYYNVKFLEEAGLSKIILEKDLTAESLELAITEALNIDLEEISKKIRDFAITDATDTIFKTVMEEIK